MLSVFITPWTKPTSIQLRDQRRLGGDHRIEQCQVRVLGGGGVGVVPGDRVIGQPAQQVDVVGGPRVLEAPDPQVAARDPGENRSGQQGLAVHGRPVATTASERVVGMPSACIASLMTYSRSIGPTTASPSPPRANGVRPGTLEMQVAQPHRRRRRARRAAGRARHPAAGCTRRTDARRRPGPPEWRRRGRRLPTSSRSPSGLRSQPGSRPSSGASGSFSTRSCGSGAAGRLP